MQFSDMLSTPIKKTLAIVAVIGTVGTGIAGLELIFGVPVRPAWGWETVELEKQLEEQKQQIEKIQNTQQESIDILTDISRSGQSQITTLNKSQLQLQLQLYAIERRDLNRELARFQAIESEMRASGRPIPDSVIRSISDTESEIHELDKSRDAVQEKLIQLEGLNHEE